MSSLLETEALVGEEREHRTGQMKKAVFTLNVGNYAPEITEFTYPLLRHYAKKIGAEFQIIDERKYPDFPPVYEKLQIYHLGRDKDWNIYIDSDALVNPNFFDPTEFVHKDTVVHNGIDMANNRWSYDQYFRRDGRHIGSCNWFTVASDWCLDLWHPLEDLTLEQAVKNIHPIWNEVSNSLPSNHLIDDYVLSRNIARYGLKLTTIVDIQKRNHDESSTYLWHMYNMTAREKLVAMKEALIFWGLSETNLSRVLKIDGWMTGAELAWLAMQAKSYSQIVEIGSHLGRSTRALALHTPGTVLAIDDFKGPRDVEIADDERKTILSRFDANMSGLDNVKRHVLDHAKLPSVMLDPKPDMIFIDGDHRYESVKRDVLWALSQIRGGGLLCGHDASYADVQRVLFSLLPKFHKYQLGDIWWVIIPWWRL